MWRRESIPGRTNNTGQYRFDNLPIGTTGSLKASGFRTTTVLAEVAINATGTVNVTLSPGAATETVEVSGEAPTLTRRRRNWDNLRLPDTPRLGGYLHGWRRGGGFKPLLAESRRANVSGLGDGIGPVQSVASVLVTTISQSRALTTTISRHRQPDHRSELTRSTTLPLLDQPVRYRVRPLVRRAIQYHCRRAAPTAFTDRCTSTSETAT